MRSILGYSITLIVILLSGTWSLTDPTCYEPTSGRGPALVSWACLQTGVDYVDHYPLPRYLLIHDTPPNPYYIQCPLQIERNGCAFTLDFVSPTGITQVTRLDIVDAILNIDRHCVGKKGMNVDGGQVVETVGDKIFRFYSLDHPGLQLNGTNTSSVGNSQPNENFVVSANLNASLVRSEDVDSGFTGSDR